jgi:dipeptidyl aminopeptidase/acylaminoacyl peptidase
MTRFPLPSVLLFLLSTLATSTVPAAGAPAAAGTPVAPGASEKRLVTLDDLAALREVSDPQISPDGTWVVYSVETVDVKRDRHDSDLYMTSWDGRRTIRLTSSPRKEHTPRFSPDGSWIAFLSKRDYKDGTDQLWLMSREGGEAERITDLKGGVTEFAWSPDGRRVVLAADDPDPDEVQADKDKGDTEDGEASTQKPIVIDRYQFKADEDEYLRGQRSHLYLLDVAARKVEPLTSGAYDEMLPAWSPDGKRLLFVTKRGPDPDRNDNWDVYVMDAKAGAAARQVTTFDGADGDPSWEGGTPAWSADGSTIAYLQGGPQKLIYYAGYHVALIPAAGGTARLVMPEVDRSMMSPRFTANGAALYFLIEDDGNVHLSRVPVSGGKPERLLAGRRVVSDYALGPQDKIAVLSSTPSEPAEVFALERGTLRPLSRQNDALMASLRLGTTDEISFKSKDGTEIHGFIVKPPDVQTGRRVPGILRIHGGPVSQFQNEFMTDWQMFAARGYAVIAANPRGSSGRGEAFARAIYADWGNKDAQDVLAAVDHAVAQGIADPARLGVGGWSYGGILTNYVIVQDQRFKAATSGAGISNILAGYGTDQYIREYENELGEPWRNTDLWVHLSSPFLHADRIVTPTLFLCGERDFNVPLLNSEQMYQALRSLGRDTQLVIYPGEYHGISTPSYLRDRLQRYLDWYGKYLK